MPIGTPFHSRTSALCVSQNWRTWSGYFAASSYEVVHDYEYHAIRNSAALIDVSPLFKYEVRGKDALRLVNRVITRDVARCAVGQALYGLHLRRRRKSNPGWNRLQARRNSFSLSPGGAEPPLAQAQCLRYGRRDSRSFGANCRCGPSRSQCAANSSGSSRCQT